MAVFQFHCFDIYNHIIYDPINKYLKGAYLNSMASTKKLRYIYKNVNWQLICSSLPLSDSYVNDRQHYF